MESARLLTECSICQDVYTNPKCLPCLHTFCCQCLVDLRLSTSNEQNNSMSCPLCREPFTIPANDDFWSLPKNFYVENLQDLLQELQVHQQPETAHENEGLQVQIRKAAIVAIVVLAIIVLIAVVLFEASLIVSYPSDQLHEEKSSNNNCELETFRFVEEMLLKGAEIIELDEKHRQMVEKALRNKLTEIFKNCDSRKEEQVFVPDKCENGEKVRKRELSAVKENSHEFWTNEKGKSSKLEHSETHNYGILLIGETVIGLIALTCCASCCYNFIRTQDPKRILAAGRPRLQYCNYSRRNRR